MQKEWRTYSCVTNGRYARHDTRCFPTRLKLAWTCRIHMRSGCFYSWGSSPRLLDTLYQTRLYKTVSPCDSCHFIPSVKQIPYYKDIGHLTIRVPVDPEIQISETTKTAASQARKVDYDTSVIYGLSNLVFVWRSNVSNMWAWSPQLLTATLLNAQICQKSRW